MENIIYFSYIPYLVDIVIFSIYGLIVIKSSIFDGDMITIFVFTLNPINRDFCIVDNKAIRA
jgi:hypothetical protein